MGILKFLGVNDCGDPIFDEPLGEELVSDLGVNLDAFPIPPEPTILDRAASAVTKIVFEARADIAKLSAEIADREERRRQAQVIVDTFEPAIQKLDDGYDASDDGAKCFDLSVETKRKRGDKHWPKRASELAAE